MIRDDIEKLIDEKLNLANELIDKLTKDYSRTDGGVRMRRIVEKEMKFLQKLKTVDDIESIESKLQSTNLIFYNHLVNSLDYYSKDHKITGIAQMQRRNADNKSIRIDIVCSSYTSWNVTWIKIIARNSESINDEVMGRCEYGSKDILEVADEFLDMASDKEKCFFCPPKVIFDFLHPIDEYLEDKLEERGIILGRKYRSNEAINKDYNENSKIDTLNIDISTMLAYVSELSNGGTNYKFKEKLLENQAAVEKKEPIKPILDAIFEGKKLIACETSVNAFRQIIKLLAGPNEMKRAEELICRLEILPDVENPESIINLDLSAQIKERSRKIFAFGIYHKAITVSSNSGFKRAARMKNLDIPMLSHSARGLTELAQREKLDL